MSSFTVNGKGNVADTRLANSSSASAKLFGSCLAISGGIGSGGNRRKGTFQMYGKAFLPSNAEVGSITLSETIKALKYELAEIASTPGETAGLVLQTAKVELTTQREESETSKSELAIPVFEEVSLSAKSEEKLTRGSKITVVFVAPSGDELLAAGDDPLLDLSSLVIAARQALLASEGGGADLRPKSVEIEVNFLLVRGAEGGAAFKAHVIDIGGSSSQVDSAGNKIILTYADPELIARETEVESTVSPIPPK